MNYPATLGSVGWIRLGVKLVPGEIRRQFLGELEHVRAEMDARQAAPWRINLKTLALLMVGFAQNVPLVGACDDIGARAPWVDRTAVAGWIFWRCSGPMLFAGYALGIVPLVVLGALSLVACFACVGALTAVAGEEYAEREARLLNAVFGGLAAVVAFVAVAGVGFGLMAALGSLFQTNALSGFSMRALVFFATLACGAVCLVGWTPREWRPSRLIRH